MKRLIWNTNAIVVDAARSNIKGAVCRRSVESRVYNACLSSAPFLAFGFRPILVDLFLHKFTQLSLFMVVHSIQHLKTGPRVSGITESKEPLNVW